MLRFLTFTLALKMVLAEYGSCNIHGVIINAHENVTGNWIIGLADGALG